MLALGIAPASAAAVDRYVDAETGDNSNVGCPQATPCETIASALANSSPGDQILIDNGTYLESVTVGGGRSLTGLDFVDGDGTAPPTIDGGAGTAVTVPASGASLIRGLRIRGDTAGVRLDGPAEVTDNLIDDPDATAAIGVHVAAGDDSAIHGNTIVDPAPGPGGSRQGVALFPVSGVHVADNTIQGMAIGISVPGATDPPIIARNLIEGTHGDFGAAIRVYCCTPLTSVLRGNTIRDPGTPLPNGIVLDDDAVLERNEVTGHDEGIFFSADTVGTTLDGDRIWGNNQGLYVFDNNPVPTQTSLSVTNATIVGNGGDVNVSQSHVALDSSIVGTMGGGINSSCTITFSRGDAIGNHPTGCDSFQTAADPMFVDPDDGDFHLAPGSPMIDMGNPAPAALGAVDFDADLREIIGTSACVARRDIGADEFLPASPVDCEPPDTTIISGPAEGERINEAVPAIGFSSEAGATFQCSENNAPFQLCSHEFHHNLGPLADGPNTFAVRAIDAAGNTDLSPDSVSFVVDTAEPETTLTKTPPKKSTRKTVKFKFESDEPGTFTCQLDQKTPFACDSPEAVDVKVGRHKFRVTATDAAGNEEPEPAKYGFRRVSG